MGCTLYSPSTSSKASTALRTHSRQGHRGIPVSTPFNSLQMVAPHLFSKFRIIALAVLGVTFPFVNAPATITAPIRAPQLLSIQPMPAAYPADSFISVSSSTGSLSSSTFRTACAQLHFPVAFNSAAAAARSSIVIFSIPYLLKCNGLAAAVAVLFKVREQRVDLRRRYANQVHRRGQLFCPNIVPPL